MKKWIELEHNIGDIVYLKTDGEQQKRIVTGINLRPELVAYALSCGDRESFHYGFEISVECDVLSKVLSD